MMAVEIVLNEGLFNAIMAREIVMLNRDYRRGQQAAGARSAG
jgi:hypothetical protein